MSPDRRSPAVPTLEVIRASDETVRAELIALPVVRVDGVDPATAGAAGPAPSGPDEPLPAA